jgi:putative toxin-antitoxin system antitoxin component (TIGR02293 family)
MATTKKNVSSGKSVGRTESTSRPGKNQVKVKSSHVKVKSNQNWRINLSSDTQHTKVFGSWLTKIIPDLDKDRGRIDDDDTMMKIVRIARKGIAQKQYAVLKKELQFSKEDWMHILDSSESTLRRLDKKDFLDKRHSEKLADIAMLGDYGEEVFGSSEIFLDWLDTESPALDDIRPKELLDTSQGISIVKMELGRIDHGITL